LKIENIAIDKLKPAKYNPRKIDEATLNRLTKNIEEFGFVDPVIINKDNTVIGGHQRIKAATKLGLEILPCIRLDLTKPKEKALNIALNKISGEWDLPMLRDLLLEIDTGEFDIELTGFNPEEIEDIVTTGDERIREKGKELKPYRLHHVLISIPVDSKRMAELTEMLTKIKAIPGVVVGQFDFLSS
jgi:ParB-like chromosome segregation protein Spo0J